MILRDSYELSLWRDVLVNDTEDSYSHFEDKKIAIIGSNSMPAEWRAQEPIFTQNINGSYQLSFYMFYTYIDTYTGEKVRNPFVGKIHNEDKIKLRYKGEWYDFIVKNVVESSDGKTVEYSCEDIFSTELSKTGFHLEFNTELENNNGTIWELGERVLEGSDWKLTDEQGIFQEKTKEATYLISDFAHPDGTIHNVLIYYSVAQNKSSYLQYWYDDGNMPVLDSYNVATNGECLAISGVTWAQNSCYYNDTLLFTLPASISPYRAERLVRQQKTAFSAPLNRWVGLYDYDGREIYGYKTASYESPELVANIAVNPNYFTSTNGWGNTDFFKIYPEYSSTTDITTYQCASYLRFPKSTSIFNKAIKSNTAYLEDGLSVGQKYRIRLKAYELNETYQKAEEPFDENAEYYIQDEQDPNVYHRVVAPEESALDSYYLRTQNDPVFVTSNISAKISNYIFNPDTNTYSVDEDVTYAEFENWQVENGWLIADATIENGISRSAIYSEPIGLFLTNEAQKDYWINDIQFYELRQNEDGEYIEPNSVDESAVITYRTKYYDPSANTGATSADEIDWLYIGSSITSEADSEWDEATAIYDENCEKIRTISSKESNRFNLLQTLAETFGVWCRFKVEHNEDGTYVYTTDEELKKTYPIKTVTFLEQVGEQAHYGFVYGIDLQAINRNVDSTSLATKVIVPQNSNEFAKNGFCTIQRATENYSKENYILDLGYFTEVGILDAGALNHDLYDAPLSDTPSASDIAYYQRLHEYNTEYDYYADLLEAALMDLTKHESYLDVYENLVSSTSEQLQNTISQMANLASGSSLNAEAFTLTEDTEFLADKTYFVKDDTGVFTIYIGEYDLDPSELGLYELSSDLVEKIGQYFQQNIEFARLQTLYNSYLQLIAQLPVYEEIAESLKNAVYLDNAAIEEYNGRLAELRSKIGVVTDLFNSKYYRYIQEGTWKSDEYIDDNLYYLDGKSVAFTSSRPQISYNISVLKLSPLEEFKNKVFRLGDLTWVEDRDFFGDDTREKVAITQIVSYLDSPDQDQIIVQNYRTQFEDLFQRTSAAVQSLQYASGEYDRAASVINPDGTIDAQTLENSIAANSQLVYSSLNNAVTTGADGITVTDIDNVSNKVKITANGIFITSDGGQTWTNAVKSTGISTQALSAGTISTKNITISNGVDNTFRWDENGISAYTVADSGLIDTSRFVRFDQYGVYGIDNQSSFIPTSEDDIFDKASYGLIWDKFFMRNRYGEGYIEVSSDKDIVVSDGTHDRIRIGRIEDGDTPVYGIVIGDNEGNQVMATDDSGKLWLRDSLHIGDGSSYDVRVGYLAPTEGDLHEVFNANGNFIVFEDGSVIANNGVFSGTIQALAGSFRGEIQATSGYLGDQNNGVIINNNGISIRSNGEDVISLDPATSSINAQNLHVTNGTFSGTLEGASGSFSGDITAATGHIGGFEISNGKLTSTDGNANIVLDGANGRITALDILIGNGAVIEDYIKVGDNSYIYNPEAHGGVFLKASDVELTDSGNLQIGNIVASGEKSTIVGTNINGVDKFLITTETSIFKDLVVSGKLDTTVFSSTSVQAAGGSMIFRPSYKVLSYDAGVIVVDGAFCESGAETEQIDKWIYAIAIGGAISQAKISRVILATSPEGTPITSITISDSSDFDATRTYISLVDLGISDEDEGDLCIGINSTTAQNKLLRPQGISFVETYENNGRLEGKLRMFLGKLAHLQETAEYGSLEENTYGLYADSVYLKGTLTTKYLQDNTDLYAGVNTINGAEFNIQLPASMEQDSSKIIFWAGAADTTAASIQNANFQVTSDGTIYAQRAYLTGSAVVNASIYGADIYTARIHGFNNMTQEAAALRIDDTAYGIIFESTEGQTFEIKNDGLYKGGKPFIELTDDAVNFTGNRLTVDEFASGGLLLTGGALTLQQGDATVGSIAFTQNSISVKNTVGNSEYFNFDFDNEINISQKALQIASGKAFKYGDNIEYKPVLEDDNYYFDLYIY